jgi:hypothetical protein
MKTKQRLEEEKQMKEDLVKEMLEPIVVTLTKNDLACIKINLRKEINNTDTDNIGKIDYLNSIIDKLKYENKVLDRIG